MEIMDFVCFGIITLGLVSCCAFFFLIVDVVGMEYQYEKNVGQWFSLSDKSSTLDKKLEYIMKYDKAINEAELTKGQSSVWFQTKDNDLTENYAVLQTLIQRMNETYTMPKNDANYQWAMSQITSEYCWFPVGVFEQAYYLKEGHWWLALLPDYNENRCEEEFRFP